MQARIVIYAVDSASAKVATDAAIAEMQRLDQILSDYREDSETSHVSRHAGSEPVAVSPDFMRILTSAVQISQLTHGHFDVTIGPVSQLWRTTRQSRQLPDAQQIADAHALVNWRAIEIDETRSTARLAHAGMSLDFGGIGKGYAVDRAMNVLNHHGITHALVSIAGDIRLGAPPPGRSGWRIAITDGVHDDPVIIHLSHCSVSTSGDAEQHILLDGARLSHIIDPANGMGHRDRIGATVIAKDATTADALATAITLMPPDLALTLIESIDGASARIARLDAQGKNPMIDISRGFPFNAIGR